MSIMIRSIVTVITLAFAVQVHAQWEAYRGNGAVPLASGTASVCAGI